MKDYQHIINQPLHPIYGGVTMLSKPSKRPGKLSKKLSLAAAFLMTFAAAVILGVA